MRTGSKRRIGLYDHAVDLAEAIEVVHVKRTEIDLQGGEHVVQVYPHAFGFGAIDVCEKLRHVDLIAREDARQFRALPGLREHRLQGTVKLLVAEPGTILQLQLEATNGAETIHRRRRKHCDEGILNTGQLLIERPRQRIPGQLRRTPILELIEIEEKHAGVG